MARLYESPDENRAYMDGYSKAIQADGMDWALARVELIALEDKVKAIIAQKDSEINRMKAMMRKQKEAYEAKVIDLESQLEAWKLAWKHRDDK